MRGRSAFAGDRDAPVVIDFRKWGDVPHWRFEARVLGEDEHGLWVFGPAGTLFERPGRRTVGKRPFVKLIAPGRWWTAMCSYKWEYDVYVDIATPPVWHGNTVRYVDLDLDVIRTHEGRTFIDDEDEFAEHRVRFAYPQHVARNARRAADELAVSVERRDEPFGDVMLAWQERMLPLV